MHPKNRYKDARPDFAALATRYASLAPHVMDGRIDFSDAAALRALTTALLKEDFDLDVKLRDDRLCPTVANRLDYALLCLDLAEHAPRRPLRALDIGTGHVAIYALLLSRLRPDAEIVATELDAVSLEHARATVTANSAGKVTVLPAPEAHLFPFSSPTLSEEDDLNGAAEARDEYFTFTMCNPPFFSSTDDAAASRDLKALPAPAAPTAAANEEITAGGEVEFVGHMIDDSVRLGEKVAWYTSLVGRYESLHELVRKLREVTGNYYVVSLRQAKTARWVLAWGFGKERLPDTMTRPDILDPSTSFARLHPLPNTFSIRPSPQRTRGELAVVVHKALKESGLWPVTGATSARASSPPKNGNAKLDTEPTTNAAENAGPETQDEATDDDDHIPLAPMANTWSRAARRAAQRGETTDAAGEPLFRARLRIVGDDDKGESGEVRLEWTWGADRAVVDGFWKFLMSKTGLLKRRSEDNGREGEHIGWSRGGGRGHGGGRDGRNGRDERDEREEGRGGRGSGRDGDRGGRDGRRGRADAGYWRGAPPVDDGWPGKRGYADRNDRRASRGGHAV